MTASAPGKRVKPTRIIGLSFLFPCEMKGGRYNFFNFMSRKHTNQHTYLSCTHLKQGYWLWVWLVLFGLTACGGNETPTPTVAVGVTADAAALTPIATAINPPALTEPLPTEPPTVAPATPTPLPLAATVNGQPILLETFSTELIRFTPPGEDTALYQNMVLDILINRTLIELAAADLNLTVTPEMLEARLSEAQQVANETGGTTGYTDWLAANGFNEETFREWVRQEMLAGLVAEQITATVPYTAPHVRARYLHVTDLAIAQDILNQMQNGGDFVTLIQLYSIDAETAANGGDLDYFPRGTLLIPEIEEAAFALAEPNQMSDLITVTGADGQVSYYLVQLIDRDETRPLDSNQRNLLLEQTFTTWLQQQREQANIIILLE